MPNQLDDLKRKNKKLKYLLGELVHKLHTEESIRFLFTSQGVNEENNVKKTLELLNYLEKRILNLEEINDIDKDETEKIEQS